MTEFRVKIRPSLYLPQLIRGGADDVVHEHVVRSLFVGIHQREHSLHGGLLSEIVEVQGSDLPVEFTYVNQ